MRNVRYNSSTGIGALAAGTLGAATLIVAADAKYRLLSLKYNAVWADIAAAIDGGLMFGVAHGDYTAAEIEEWLESTTSIDQGDKIAGEKANRLCRILGTMGGTGVAEGDGQFNNGVEKSVRLNWEIPIGIEIKFWIYNNSKTIYTTGSEFVLTGSAVVRYA